MKGLKTYSKEFNSGSYIRGSDGKLSFNENERGKFWKDYMTRIINEENDCERNVEVDVVKGQVVCVSRDGMVSIR